MAIIQIFKTKQLKRFSIKHKERQKISPRWEIFAHSFIWHNHWGMWVKEMEVSPQQLRRLLRIVFRWNFLCHASIFSFRRRFWWEDHSKMFSISLICIRRVDGVCWTRRREQRAKLFLDRKMIATISGNLHSKLIIQCANDGESSQNWSDADQTSFECAQHMQFAAELLNGTVLCLGREIGSRNWPRLM